MRDSDSVAFSGIKIHDQPEEEYNKEQNTLRYDDISKEEFLPGGALQHIGSVSQIRRRQSESSSRRPVSATSEPVPPSLVKSVSHRPPGLMRRLNTSLINLGPTHHHVKTVRFKTETVSVKDTWNLMDIMEPDDPFLKRWRSAGIIFLCFNFFRLPMVIAWGNEGVMWDLAMDAYFFFDHVLAFVSGYYTREHHLVMDRTAIFKRYFAWSTFAQGYRQSIFIFVMEFIPFYLVWTLMHFNPSIPFWALSIACLPRGRRLWDLLALFREQERDMTKDVRMIAFFKYVIVMIGSGHWFASFWWLLARVADFSDNSWIGQFLSASHWNVNHNFKDLSTGTAEYVISYQLSLLWGYSTLTGIGFTGYTPTATVECVGFIGMTYLEVLCHSFLFGILLHFIVRKDVSREKYNMMMDKVEKYVSMYNLPRKLEDAMKLFYTFQYRKKVGADEEVMKTIPKALRMKVMVHQYQYVSSDPVFVGCPNQFVSTLLSLLKPKILTPGTQIYSRNDVSREVCFLERGEVEMYDEEAEDTDPIKLLKPGETCLPAIGEISFFLGIPQCFTFIASTKSDVKLLTLSKEDYDDVKDRFPDARDILIDNVRALVGLGKADSDLIEYQAQTQPQPISTNPMMSMKVASDGKDTKAAELKKRVQEALRTKLDDDMATMFNAIREGELDEVKLLLSKGYNPNATDYGDDKIVELLIQHGADVHVRDRWGRNALQEAVDNNHIKVIQQLSAQGAELKLDNAAGRLCSAAYSDNLFELQRLVENGIDANSSDYDRRTSLHLSACEGNNKIVEFLLLPMSKGDPGVTDRWGISPLFDAIKHGNPSVAHILFENGARLSIDRAATFLCMSAAEGDFPMLRLLSECGIETNIADYDNRYPIHLAAAEGEVVSVHFLTYAHADISVKDRWGRTPLDDAIQGKFWRRTPLDDAIQGKFWRCAKLLACYGAKHTVPWTEDVQRAIDNTDLDEIREHVRMEKIQQEKRKDTEKHLRDHVKWLIGDSETWQKVVIDKLGQLERIMEKYLGMEELDSIQKEAGQFMEQADEDILTAEKNDRSDALALPANTGRGQDYILHRFIHEARTSAAIRPSLSFMEGGHIHLKSMQHFFLKLGMIESAMQSMHFRVIEKAGGPSVGRKPTITRTILGRVLSFYGLPHSEKEIDRILSSCSSDLKLTLLNLDDQKAKEEDPLHTGVLEGMSIDGAIMVPPAVDFVVAGTRDEGKEESKEGGSTTESDPAAAAPSPNSEVTYDSFLTSMPLWELIADAPPRPDIMELQEAVRCVFQGFYLLDEDDDGRLTRGEWRVLKRAMDLGNFGCALDNIFDQRTSITIDLFFLMVVDWAVLQDAEDRASSSIVRRQIENGNGLDDTHHMYDDHYYQPNARRHRANDSGNSSVASSVGTANLNDLKDYEYMMVHMNEMGSVQNIRNGPSVIIEQPQAIEPLVIKPRVNVFNRFLLRQQLKTVEKRLALQVRAGLSSTMDEIMSRFFRLDTAESGRLDDHKAQLLISWSFDLDLPKDSWDCVMYNLIDDKTGMVHKDVLLGWIQHVIELGMRRSWMSTASKTTTTKVQRAVKAVIEWGFIADHEGRFAEGWRLIRTLSALYSFLCVPYHISFLRQELCTVYFSSLLASWFFDVILVFDMLIKFNTSFTDEKSLKVFDRARIRDRYLQSDFLLDFLAILPADLLAYFSGSSGSLVAFLRVPKLMHTPKLYRVMRNTNISERSSSTARLMADIQSLYTMSLALIHILACIWYYMTEGEQYYDLVSNFDVLGNPWDHSDNGGPFKIRYYIYCYAIIIYIISVQGLPTTVVTSPPEVWFIILVIILHLSAWSYLMGTISGLFVSSDESIAQSHEMMGIVVNFINQNNIPPDIGEELITFFNMDVIQKGSLSLKDQNTVYRNLPLSIQVQLARHICRDLLTSVEIFQKTSDYFLDSVSTLLQVDVLAQGEYLYKAGAVCRSLYIVASGTVETVKLDPEKHDWTVQGVHEAGHALGQLEFCFDIRYMNAARVVGGDSVRVFRLDKENYQRIVKLYPMDEDIIHQNTAELSEEEKYETGSTVKSMHSIHSGTSIGSLESSMRNVLDENELERAMADIDKAKARSREQRIRSFCNAAALGNEEWLGRLLKSGIKINNSDANGRTALMLATCSGHLSVVKNLVAQGADVNLKDKFGGSALLDAMNGGHKEIMALLKRNGAVLELNDAAGTLCELAADGKVEKLRLLLTLGIDPNVADYDKRTPLHTAASEGHLECVKLLLDFWADVNPLDRMNGTPLTDSVRHGHIEVQKYLRARGGRLIIDPVTLGTTLCEAASVGDLQRIQILYENGANINQGDYDGRTALHLAACCNKLSVIEYLVNVPGININPLDRCVGTPLDDAIREKQPHIASILQSKGGLSGKDPKLEHSRVEHYQSRNKFFSQKAVRREEKIVLFNHQTDVLERLREIHQLMSDNLPLLCKYVNLLTMTLRSRRNISVVDRTPHPTMSEVRTYFFFSLKHYLERMYIQNYDTFLTICEEYWAQDQLEFRSLLVEKLFHQFIDVKAPEHIQMDPHEIRLCRERLLAGLEEGVLPDDLLTPLENHVKKQLQALLEDYFQSNEFYGACRKSNGFMWRVVKLARLSYDLCTLLLDKVWVPLVDMCDQGELAYVPHFSPQNREKFQNMYYAFLSYFVKLKAHLHVVAFLAKESAIREKMRDGHATAALSKGVKPKRKNAMRNY